MTRVDFYILAAQTLEARNLFICRLVNKAVSQGQNVFINVDQASDAQVFDDLLWNFRAESFVPHEIQHAHSHTQGCPVHIGWSTPINEHSDVMINAGNRLPDFFGRFSRLIEVVVQDDAILQYTREHYRFLSNRGYAIDHQDMRLGA